MYSDFPFTGFSIAQTLNSLRDAAHYAMESYVCQALHVLNHKLRSIGLSKVHDADIFTFNFVIANYNLPFYIYFPALVELHVLLDRLFRHTGFLREANYKARTSILLRNDFPWRISYPARLTLYQHFVLPSVAFKFFREIGLD
jgi:hypothetical protein